MYLKSLLSLISSLLLINGLAQDLNKYRKISGVNLVSPTSRMDSNYVAPVKRVSANWIAILPYAFMDNTKPAIEYNCEKNWWGDIPEGINETVKYARKDNLKILLKPHFWVDGKGWAGELELNEKDWLEWEQNYSSFILNMAHFAEENKLEMLCIGTELKSAIKHRGKFWNLLIKRIRSVYSGKLIYAANWDNYRNITFWDDIDYIGIDAYFPLSPKKTPPTGELLRAWQEVKYGLKKYSDSIGKPIIFTEMGYRSIDYTAWKQWEIESLPSNENLNLEAQKNAYEALFESFWEENWFAGGFLWKWKHPDENVGGAYRSDYSPQHKPVEQIIKKWYLKECRPPSLSY